MKTRELKPLLLFEEFWRCGTEPEVKIGASETARGNGLTRLLNDKGYMCCLGQFSKQLKETIRDEELLANVSPDSLRQLIPDLTYIHRSLDTHTNTMRSVIRNTPEATEAIVINDDQHSTVQEKVEKLKEVVAKIGYELIFIPRKNPHELES